MSYTQVTSELFTILGSYWTNSMAFLPKLMVALILVSIGVVLGKMAKMVLKNLFMRYKVGEALFKNPVFKLSVIVSTLVAWSIYLLFIKAAVDVLQIEALMLSVDRLIGLLPKVIESVVILFLGYVFAEFFKQQVEKSKMDYAEIMSKVIFFLVIYISFAIALPIIEPEVRILENLLLIAAGSVGLGVAIAIGLNLKDVLHKEARKYRRKKK